MLKVDEKWKSFRANCGYQTLLVDRSKIKVKWISLCANAMRKSKFCAKEEKDCPRLAKEKNNDRV